MTVTNTKGIASEPDEGTIIANPIATAPPEKESPRIINDIIKDMIQNPLDVTNSIDSAKEVRYFDGLQSKQQPESLLFNRFGGLIRI